MLLKISVDCENDVQYFSSRISFFQKLFSRERTIENSALHVKEVRSMNVKVFKCRRILIEHVIQIPRNQILVTDGLRAQMRVPISLSAG